MSCDRLWHTRTAKILNAQRLLKSLRTGLGLLLGMRVVAKLGVKPRLPLDELPHPKLRATRWLGVCTSG